jgi:hypothetical protein
MIPAFRNAYIFLLIALTSCMLQASAQNTRLNDHNHTGWYSFLLNHQLNSKWSVQLEYVWRRDEFIKYWQQSLLRPAINYNLAPNAQLQAGYGWIETYNYGEYPLNSFGRQFPEHRLHEQILLKQTVGRVDVQHRLRQEQRWVGWYNNATSESPESYTYTNRTRYMLRVQSPLQGSTLDDHEFYAAAYDELFVGYGKNVGENIFDQNRIGILAGYRLNKHFRLEGGYLGQTLQLGRKIANRNVLQYNEGFILSLVVNTGNGK